MITSSTQMALVLGLVALAGQRAAWAAGVVGSGTAASCTDAALDTALSGGGLVTFNCGLATVTIDIISTNVIGVDTIVDGGNLITIGGNGVHVFRVVDPGVSLTVQNVTIANGNGVDGGGIYNAGTLIVINSTFTDNTACCSGHGGGIFNDTGTVTVTNSTFTGNSAEIDGGGIFNQQGTLTVTNSTFSGNSAAFSGGGILSHLGPLTVTNSTFAGNSATTGGGIFNEAGEGLLRNTIVANSLAGGDCFGTTDGGHNLDDDGTCGLSIANGSLSNTTALLDPAGLKNNGGPTQTIALLLSSSAIDHGDPSVCAASPVDDIDQRGLPRRSLSDPICDIGAFEVQRSGAPAPVVSSAGLMALMVLLAAVGWLGLRRPVRL